MLCAAAQPPVIVSQAPVWIPAAALVAPKPSIMSAWARPGTNRAAIAASVSRSRRMGHLYAKLQSTATLGAVLPVAVVVAATWIPVAKWMPLLHSRLPPPGRLDAAGRPNERT